MNLIKKIIFYADKKEIIVNYHSININGTNHLSNILSLIVCNLFR